MLVWRLTKTKYAPTAYDGRGAAMYGGRWNSPGQAIVYTSESRALALLELLVHLDQDLLLAEYSMTPANIPDDAVLHADDIFPGWEWSEPQFLRRLGDNWLRSRASVAVIVPSAVVREERNILLNPDHPQFADVALGDTERFVIDPRLRRA